jgi:hypothetical protein
MTLIQESPGSVPPPCGIISDGCVSSPISGGNSTIACERSLRKIALLPLREYRGCRASLNRRCELQPIWAPRLRQPDSDAQPRLGPLCSRQPLRPLHKPCRRHLLIGVRGSPRVCPGRLPILTARTMPKRLCAAFAVRPGVIHPCASSAIQSQHELCIRRGAGGSFARPKLRILL